MALQHSPVADQILYIEQLAEYWGELCGSRELASEWADRLIGITAVVMQHRARLTRDLEVDPRLLLEADRSAALRNVLGRGTLTARLRHDQ